jgi:hypothetical protein
MEIVPDRKEDTARRRVAPPSDTALTALSRVVVGLDLGAPAPRSNGLEDRTISGYHEPGECAPFATRHRERIGDSHRHAAVAGRRIPRN